jgi:hypothetical protein
MEMLLDGTINLGQNKRKENKMGEGEYCYVGVFLNGECVERIGGKIFIPKEDHDRYMLFLNGFTGLLDRLYKPVGEEYIAFDYD